MSDWVERAVKSLREEEKRVGSQRKWLLYVDRMIRIQSPRLWGQLCDEIKKLAKEWNASIPATHPTQIHIRDCVNGLSVRTCSFPCASANITFSSDDREIVVSLTLHPRKNSTPLAETTRIGIEVSESDGNVYFMRKNRPFGTDEVAQNILALLIPGMAPHW